MRRIDPFMLQLRNRRMDLGLSQLRLAGLSGVHQSKISGYEVGKISPSFNTLRRLMNALECDVELRPKPSEVDNEQSDIPAHQ